MLLLRWWIFSASTLVSGCEAVALRFLAVVVQISGVLADMGFWCCLEVFDASFRASVFGSGVWDYVCGDFMTLALNGKVWVWLLILVILGRRALWVLGQWVRWCWLVVIGDGFDVWVPSIFSIWPWFWGQWEFVCWRCLFVVKLNNKRIFLKSISRCVFFQ